jgi:hypothetical protein
MSISNQNTQVRFQMQPATPPTRAGATGRGGNFANRLGKPKNATSAYGGQGGDDKPKVKKRKPAPQFDQKTDLEIEARMLEAQMQAERQARPAPSPTSRLI